MRINIVIDDQLLAEAQRVTGITSKKDVVETALKMLLRMKQQEDVKAWRGKLLWDEDPEAMRAERLP